MKRGMAKLKKDMVKRKLVKFLQGERMEDWGQLSGVASCPQGPTSSALDDRMWGNAPFRQVLSVIAPGSQVNSLWEPGSYKVPLELAFRSQGAPRSKRPLSCSSAQPCFPVCPPSMKNGKF